MSCNDGGSLNRQRIGNIMWIYGYTRFNVCPVWGCMDSFFWHIGEAWLLYEKVLRNHTNEIIMNLKIANIVEMIFIMIFVYLVAYYKKPELCVVMPSIQMLIEHSIRLYKQQTDRNIIIFVGIVVEFIFSIKVSM